MTAHVIAALADPRSTLTGDAPVAFAADINPERSAGAIGTAGRGDLRVNESTQRLGVELVTHDVLSRLVLLPVGGTSAGSVDG